MGHLKIKAFPGAKKEIVEQKSSDQYIVYLREPAKDNMANRAVVRIMARHLDLLPHQLRIISGHQRQNKILEIIT